MFTAEDGVNALSGRGIYGLFSERADTLDKLDTLLDKFGMKNILKAEASDGVVMTNAYRVVLQQNKDGEKPPEPSAPPFEHK